MVVKRIEIENYKGFEKQGIAFEDNLNVFIGANASGKTSLLEAVVKCLYAFVLEVEKTYPISSKSSRKEITNGDVIRYGEKYYSITSYIELVASSGFPINVWSGSRTFSYEKEQENLPLKGFIQLLDKSQTLPIFRYYPVKRNTIQNSVYPEKNRLYEIGQMEAWDNIIQDPDVSFTHFARWFYNYETLELRLKRDESDHNVQVPQLKYIRSAVQKALYRIYGKNYVIKSNGEIAVGHHRLTPQIFIKQEDGQSNSEENLITKSDGEKAIITLVADIAYNLALAHDFNQDEEYLNAPGIVLIDEIEQHLHPNWQRKIIPILTAVFPKIQFFITTHSPQVISSVNSKNIFLCDNFNIEKVNLKTKGVDSNSLLKFLFNATDRPKPYIDLINEFDEIIENQGSLEKLEHIIQEITKLENEDTGNDISGLIEELRIRLEAYKFELEHEVD